MSNLLKKVYIAGLASMLATGGAMADAKAEKVLKKARIASTLGDQTLNGSLRKGSKRSPIGLALKGKDIQFTYLVKGSWVKFNLRLEEKGAELREKKGGKWRKFSKKKITEKVVGTDLTYEDLSMKFLYWKKATVVRQESIKTQKCDVVRLLNPGGDGQYEIVYVWVHQKYGSLMKIEGYNKKGHRMKKFAIDKLMKIGKQYTLERMRVDTYNPDTKKNIGTTYLEFKKPKRKSGGGL